VAAVVRRGWVAPGPEVSAFEHELAARLGTEAVAAVSSGSAALELALRALGVGPGHEVVIPTYVCDALHHAVGRTGATPVLADADRVTLSVSAVDARARLTPRTRCIIVPHAFGLAADLRGLLALGVPVIEDCAQTLGARLDDRPVGSFGTLAVCSFYATKLLTTGEGGAVAGPAALIERVRDVRDYDERDDLAPRVNAKLSDLAAALGRSQLERFDGFVARRRAVAARYRERLRGLPCSPPPDVGPRHVYHRFVVEVERPPDAVRAALHARGVAARRPVYRPAHQALGLRGFPQADRLWARTLSLPCYPTLTDVEIDTVTTALGEALA
jgi:dTDP-4-amino-4,6-dideoxygalactose transaminase